MQNFFTKSYSKNEASIFTITKEQFGKKDERRVYYVNEEGKIIDVTDVNINMENCDVLSIEEIKNFLHLISAEKQSPIPENK